MDLAHLAPLGAEALLTTLGLLVIAIGIATKGRSGIVGIISLIGLVASLGLVLTAKTGTIFFYETISVDGFSQFFKAVFIVVSLLVVIAAMSKYNGRKGGDEFFGLLLLATVGMMVVSSAIDIVTLFVGFELASLSTYALAGFDKSRKNLEAAMKYFLFGSVSSAFMLFGFSLLYGMTGSTRIAEIASVALADFSPAVLVALIFVIAGFAFKMALVPFHMWAPDTYEGAPPLVSALLAAGSKKMGFAAAFRILFVALVALRFEWYMAFAILAAVTMTLGNLVACWQNNVRRILAYSSIAQAGYIAIAVVVVGAGAGMSTPDGYSVPQFGLAGALLLILGHALMKTGAFIGTAQVADMVGKSGDTDPDDISNYAGLYKRAPITALCMAIFMLALAGIPPSAGYIGKFVLFGSAIYAGLVWLAVLAILNSALSLYYYLRIISYMYLKDPNGGRISEPKGYVLSLLVTLIGVLWIGLAPQGFIDWAIQAAAVLLP
ncbi:MAG: F(420)H(2) dehydrogenase subunit N [Methanosaeta sp. PtaB.Bin039]|nr:MAG: F(420)H(2) dehydrogenase subunit N [Methanosaeta sp. PtaB.Bin039]OPY45223.1 MAG: F(420)H(2) dehydrogenase subunit N [Methanosaeta sp. PtaU1.Bin028]HQF16609.1 NADH-quinone oxidoreductase subunit N [Methanotrichaceae archaeon]HQI91241.1 NADH-quinone oxidoreductase subunit N [Methanotrichaceae archaeon]HQJ61711.1 NADH-quinone oxidoreductase subunit N [Methanothrix soehngenii]